MNVVRIYEVGISGSTVIGAYLAGRTRNAIHNGEAVRVDRPSLIKANPVCTCGVNILECPFWKSIDRDGYRVAVKSIASKGYSTVIDSSKSSEIPTVDGVDVIPIHLVKDPRASTWSWFRTREIVNPAGMKETLKKVSWLDLPKVILSTYKNFIKFRIRNYPLIRYERFCREPDVYLRQILSKMNLAIEDSRPYSQESNHGVGGNVARYGLDGTLNAESKWKEEASLIYQWAVSIAYLPMLVWIRWGSR